MSDTEKMDIVEVESENDNNNSELDGENNGVKFPTNREEGDHSWHGEDSAMEERKYHANKTRLERNGGKIPEGNITLKFPNEQTLELPQRYLEMIKTYHEMLSDNAELNTESSINELNVIDVSKKIMEYILEYFNHYGDDPLEYELFLKLTRRKTDDDDDDDLIMEEDLSEWDNNFFGKIFAVSKYELEAITSAANFLHIPTLYEKACKFYAEYIKKNRKEMNVEGLRNFFDLENDWTPEEYAEECKKHAWIDEVETNT